MINSTKQRYLFAVEGAVNETVGSDSLGKGQFMIGDVKKNGNTGFKPATNLSAIRKDEKRLKILVGEDKKNINSRSYVHGAAESEIFSLSQIREIRQTAPKNLEAKVDEWHIGWTGRLDEPETSLSFTNSSKPFRIYMKICGGRVPWSGGGVFEEIIDFVYPIETNSLFNPCEDVDKCDPIPCQGVVEDIVKRLKKLRTSGGRVLEELVDISPIVSCAESTTTSTLTYFTLTVCDTGDQLALSKVQNEYPDLKIKRLTRVGAMTTYQTLAETIPADYSTTSVQVIPTCDVCPGGFTTIDGGYVYVVTVVDEGTDESANIEVSLGALGVTVTAVRQGTESGTNTGVYSVLVSAPVEEIQIDNLVADYPSGTIQLVGDKDTVCSQSTTITTDWIEGDTCDLSEETYTIVLPDDGCGNDRLEELQAAYPDLTITIASDNAQSVVTLTGTSGTANITINGVDYLATFNTNLTTTATDFVTAHQAALTTAGITVSANAGVLTFVHVVAYTTTITNATGDLAGTVVRTLIPDTEACSTRYTATVGTNMVCDECDDVFKDFFTSEVPQIYDGEQWTLLTRATTTDGDCLCGIKIRSKMFKMEPDSRYFYKYPYFETSANIYVDAGFQDYENLVEAGKGFSVPAHKRQVSFKKDRDMLFGDLMGKARHANSHSHGMTTGFNQMADDFLGMSLPFNTMGAQAVQFSIDIDHDRLQQGFQDRSGVTRTINIFVEYGKHDDIEAKINELASAAGKQVLDA